MNKILEFIRKHSKITVILIILCSLLPLIIVHILFKWNSGIAFLVAEWSAGELLGYIGTLLSFWGTIILGWLALQASNKANELSRRVIELEQDHYRLEMRPFVLVSNWKAYGYSFDEDIVDFTKSGSVSVLSKDQITELNDISIHEPLNTHKHGKEYHHCVAEIGYKANLDYSSTNTIMRKLFLNGVRCDAKILRLETRNLYAFIINNERRLIEDVRDAMADESLQLTLAIPRITEKPVGFPLEMIFTYDGTSKSQTEYTKNVYTGYLSSAEKRSMPEKLFERFCEGSGKVKWFYKNGDKGAEYFSIVYTDNFGKQKSFYPDYVVGINDGGIWIIETKGGFTKSGNSEDIDRFTAKKFGVLRKYLDGYNLQGGIVRQDKQSGELCICVDKYSDNIHDENWQLLSEVL